VGNITAVNWRRKVPIACPIHERASGYGDDERGDTADRHQGSDYDGVPVWQAHDWLFSVRGDEFHRLTDSDPLVVTGNQPFGCAVYPTIGDRNQRTREASAEEKSTARTVVKTGSSAMLEPAATGPQHR
jgi:hypothetical protein